VISVYYAPPSIFGRKVLAVLEEKELDYSIKPLSFAERDMDKPDYLRMSPNGEIPTLSDENFTVYESTAIIEYLNDEYPEPPLMPEDSEGRARVRMIEDFCDLHLFPALVKCVTKKFYSKEELNDGDQKMVQKEINRVESYLGGQNYLAGTFSLADCAFMAAVATLDALGLTETVCTSGPLTRYIERIKQHKGYKGANLLTLEQPAENA